MRGTGCTDGDRPGNDLMYSAIALRSSLLNCELENSTSSAIGPVAAAIRLWPLLRYLAMSSPAQSPRPLLFALRQVGAEPSLRGIALEEHVVLVRAEKILRCMAGGAMSGAVTRYAPRFHSAERDGSL